MSLKVALFTGDEVMALCDLSILVPEMQAMGLEPILINTESIASRKIQRPELSDIRFYESDLFQRVVDPFLNAQ